MQITAAITEEKGAPFMLEEVDLGDLRDDEVRVRVAAAGICHTDLIVRDQWYPVPLPAVLGHEGAGVVEAVGRAVTAVAVGDRVGMTFNSCGRCRTCLVGRPSYCHSFFAYNFGASRPADGSSVLSRHGESLHAHFFGQSSFATHAVASQRNVVRLDDAVPFEVAAPFGCGIQTGAGAVLNSLKPPAGSTLAVFGTGAVGLSAISAAGIVGCSRIIGVDRNLARLELARSLGATDVIDAGEVDAAEAVTSLTAGGADFSLETTGSPAVLRQAVDSLAPTGVCGVIGAPPFGTEVSLDVNGILALGRVLRGIVEGDSVPELFLPALLGLWQSGRFPVDQLFKTFDFDAINEAARSAEEGHVIKPVLLLS